MVVFSAENDLVIILGAGYNTQRRELKRRQNLTRVARFIKTIC